MLNNEASAMDVINVLPAVSAANTAAATSGWIDLGASPHEGSVLFVMSPGALTGSMTSLIQDADDGGGTNAAAVAGAAFATAVANTPQKLVVQKSSMRRYVRFVGTVVTGPILLNVVALARLKFV